MCYGILVAERKMSGHEMSTMSTSSILRLLLRGGLPYNVYPVTNGEEAAEFAMCNSNKVHMVFIDIYHNDAVSVETLFALRNIGCRIPAIAVMGFGVSMDEVRDGGFCACLVKPLFFYSWEFIQVARMGPNFLVKWMMINQAV